MKLLTDNQIKYVLFHLLQHWQAKDEVLNLFYFVDKNDFSSYKNSIIFPLSGDENICPIEISVLNKTIPILFPCEKKAENKLFEMDSAGNLLFKHDYLKSAFYFLSGIQEIENKERDAIGRFPYSVSIQKQLACCTIPVVNYYFEIILQGLEMFCQHHKTSFERKYLFDNFGFFLSHDVDQIEFFHYRETAYKLKQLLGLSPLNYSRKLTLNLFIKGLFHLINPFREKDPWWNFDEMITLEKRLGIRSAFYFLRKERGSIGSRYLFSNRKIKKLIKTLENNDFEIGLHGTFFSADNDKIMMHQTKEFSSVYGKMPHGIRHHFLRFFHPKTFRLHEKAGLRYDTSLAFVEHEGYRNGYCYPFHPYDVENDRMFYIWEIPLIMMEQSVLHYRKLDFAGLEEAAFALIEEALKFGGMFSLLWHNSRLTEYEYPGVNIFYAQLLEKIVNKNPDIFTGKKLIEKLC